MEEKPEHHDAGNDDHSGKPGAGGKPMVPRTHEHDEAEKKHEWTYQDPETWSHGYADCAKQAQSPVNLVKTKMEKGKEKLKFEYSPQEDLHVDNKGHNIQVNGKFGSLELPDGKYNVAQFHFHFPSEHKVNGKLASGEIHIVHQKEGATGTDDLAVVGILLQEKAVGDTKWDRSKEIAFLSQLHFGQSLPKEGESEKIMGAVDLGGAFSNELKGDFFHYKGSLTTPPCSQTVHWFVLEEPAAVTSDMVKHFKELFADPANNRPDQLLYGRPVLEDEDTVKGEYGKDKKEKSSSHSLHAFWSLATLLSLFATFHQ